MTVFVVAGRGGTGKTSQIRELVRLAFIPTKWAIMEKKDERNLHEVEGIDATLIYAVNAEYNTDPVEILIQFSKWRDSILQRTNEYKCIVVDGISDLRDYAIDEWLYEHPIYDKKTGEERERKTIGGENIGAWGEINKRVRLLVEPLINYAQYHSVHLFLTAQMKDVYAVVDRASVRVGEEPDIKTWLEYPCECLLVMRKNKNSVHYECSCEKSPLWAGDSGWVEELQKDMGLLSTLSKHKLL